MHQSYCHSTKKNLFWSFAIKKKIKNTQKISQTECSSKTLESLKYCTWQAFNWKTRTGTNVLQKALNTSATVRFGNVETSQKGSRTGAAWKAGQHLGPHFRRRHDNAVGQTAQQEMQHQDWDHFQQLSESIWTAESGLWLTFNPLEETKSLLPVSNNSNQLCLRKKKEK